MESVDIFVYGPVFKVLKKFEEVSVVKSIWDLLYKRTVSLLQVNYSSEKEVLELLKVSYKSK